MLAAWGRFVYRWRWITLVVSAILLVGSIAALARGGTLKNAAGEGLKGTGSWRAFTLIQDELPRGGTSFALIFGSDSQTINDPRFRDPMQAALAPLRADSRVKSITTPYDVSPQLAAGLQSKDGRHALAVVTVNDDFTTARQYYPQLRALVHSNKLTVVSTDNLAIAHDFDRILATDLERAERVSLPLSLLLLLLVFGTVVAALLPLGVGVLAIIGGLAGVYLLSHLTDVSPYALNIVTLIGLGVAIDYSLFIVNRFREELAAGASRPDALANTLATAGRAIVFSGLTVAIGLSGMLFYRGTFLSSLGLAGAIVVGLSIFYGLTFLPGLLAVLGPRVNSWRVPLPRRAAGRGFWHVLAGWVMRRPLLALVPALAILLLAGSPFRQLRLANGDVTMLPLEAESRQGYEELLKDFPGRDQTVVNAVVSFPTGRPLAPEHIAALYDLSRRIAKLPNVLRIQSVVDIDPTRNRSDYQAFYLAPVNAMPLAAQEVVRQTIGEHIAVLNVYTARPANSEEARALVRAIRADHVPDGELVVGGQTAVDIDFINFIVSHTPVAVVYIIMVTYLVLFLLVGSVILPLKAVVMNLLSVSASFGAMVWIFQQGHLSGLLHFTAAPIDPTLPVLLFCIVFGLSMDYEVLLLSRIQEEYRRSGDNRQAVALGLERSGRLITGAAAIMVVVFSAFGLADVVIIKAIGLGLAIAVLIDATLVRALVVPAAMRLLGRLNWWAPSPLLTLQQRLGLGETDRSAAA